MNQERIGVSTICELQDLRRTVEWCMKMNLILSAYVCPVCGQSMSCESADVNDKYVWRCKKDGQEVNIRTGSWFEESKLIMYQILYITLMWTFKWKIDSMFEAGVSYETVVDWERVCREICIDACLNENDMLRGEGIVDIFESEFGERKYRHGRTIDGKWVLGGVERGTNKCFMVVVSERSNTVLMNVLRENVRPGCIIIIRDLDAYGCLDGIKQLTENYKIDSKSRASTWGTIKGKLSAYRSQDDFASYLFEHIWRRKHKKEESHLMNLFLQAVSRIYRPAQHK